MDSQFDYEGKVFRGTGVSGVSPRANNSRGGTTVYFNGSASTDGLSVSSEARRKTPKPRKEGRVMKFIMSHPLSIAYWVATFVVGAWWQGWII